ncbi:hypothetical protein [Pacificispira sp.]|uniref:thiolase family protein n=1 Tax=Pacificispira sp. TaxID=2888761 RepID=UPI003B5291F7
MRDAVIVSTARTPIGKAYRGALNATTPQRLAAHVIEHAIERAGIEAGEVEDVILGVAMQQGFQGGNFARQSALRAGLPISVAGMTLDRQCSSGMMAIATDAKQVIHDGISIAIGGGVESTSLVRTEEMRSDKDPWLAAQRTSIYMSMIETAEMVAERYKVPREAQVTCFPKSGPL